MSAGGDDYFDPSMGSFFFGHPGALYPIHAVVEPYDVDDDEGLSLSRSLGGGIRARTRRARASRSWGVTIPKAFPQDVINFREIVTTTLGPYVWVDPWAQVTNVLTPEMSTMGSLVSPAAGLPQNGGGWRLVGLDNQWAALTRSNPGKGGVWVGPAPIPPSFTGRPVTASIWLASTTDTRVNLQWLDGSGSVMSAVQGNIVTGLDGLRRSVATGVPPWGASAARIYVAGSEVLARPAITWTDKAVPWDVGNGAQQVEVSDASRKITRADSAYRIHDLSFTVTEVGPAEVMG